MANTPENNRKHQKTRRHKVSEYIRDKKDFPCLDCGVKYPYYVMQFDHVRGTKLFGLGTAVRAMKSWQQIDDEIAKCELVCANCHFERSQQRLMRARLGD